MKLIVGLGNPGKEYEKTRHNSGFMAMDYLSDKMNVSITTKKWNALIGKGNVNHREIGICVTESYGLLFCFDNRLWCFGIFFRTASRI